MAGAVLAACSLADTAAACYTASWYLVWAQVRSWLLVQLPVAALAVGFEWLEVASYSLVDRLRRVCDSPLTNVAVRGASYDSASYLWGFTQIPLLGWTRTRCCRSSPASTSASRGVSIYCSCFTFRDPLADEEND